ncbi:MAG: hypothetical protein Q4C12_05815 [Clostridia bacterium]|nr:hypothetical protein [Clostridia bacterium]
MSKRKKEEKQKASTRRLIGVREITDFSLVTYEHGELVLFLIKPSNISVMSEDSVRARIYAMMTVLKGMAEIEMCCYNSRENFDGNKRYLKKRMKDESNYIINQLLEKDMTHLDNIQIQTATAREFAIVVRLLNQSEKELIPYLNRIEKTLREQGFSIKRADENDLKRLLAVYFEQNVTQEAFENHDGERWVIFGD